MLSLGERLLVLPESAIVPRESLNRPDSVPELPMSTVPLCEAPPGRRFDAVKTAEFSEELEIASVPELNVFAGFAELAVKSAPDPTTTAPASARLRRAPSARRGCETRTCSRDMGTSFTVAWDPRRLRASGVSATELSRGARPLALRPRLATGLPRST